MPAKSKSQQRLFGMVHAYNKGAFHGNRSLRKRLAELSKHISDEDATHFAKTPHEGLPEKAAQVMLRPEDVQSLYGKIPLGVYLNALSPRSEKRRSFLGRILRGTAVGAVAGGLGAGGLGIYLAHRVGQSTPGLSSTELHGRMGEAGAKLGLWGLGHGALVGAVTGLGLGILDKVRG